MLMQFLNCLNKSVDGIMTGYCDILLPVCKLVSVEEYFNGTALILDYLVQEGEAPLRRRISRSATPAARATQRRA